MSKSRRKKISSIGSQISTIISVALVLLIVGLIILVSSVTHGANNTIRENMAITVRMNTDAPSSQISSLSDMLRQAPYAASVHFTSAAEVLEIEKNYNADILEVLGDNPFAAEFEIFLQPEYANTSDIKRIAKEIQSNEGVDSVTFSSEVVDNINNFLSKATLYLSFLGIGLLLISLVLIFNTVSLLVYTRRFIIHTMKLVGATSAFILNPIVWSGVVLGLISGILASAVMLGLYFYSESQGIAVLLFVDITHTVALCGLLVVTGIVFCALASFIAAKRYIGFSYDDLYMS